MDRKRYVHRLFFVMLCLLLVLGMGMTAGAKSKKKKKKRSFEKQVEARVRYAKLAMKGRVRPDRKLKKYTYFYIGASRVEKLSKSVSDRKTYFLSCPGAGCKWLGKGRGKKKSAIYYIRSYLAVRPEGNVIIELGNNLPEFVDAYVRIYKMLIEAYPEAHFWFVDVLPRSGSENTKKVVKLRKQFNARLRKEFPENYLGGANFLAKSPGFMTYDGNHYPAYVERNLYQYLMERLGRKIRYSGKKVIEVE